MPSKLARVFTNAGCIKRQAIKSNGTDIERNSMKGMRNGFPVSFNVRRRMEV